MKIFSALLSLMLIALLVELPAQIVVPAKVQKGDKTLISVPVTVSDREGRYISGLKKDDFTVLHNGVKQNIAFFEKEDEPISVALLLDTSVSTRDVLDKIKEAAKDFVDLLNPTDKCLVATFDSDVKVFNSLTSDQKTIKDSLDKIQTSSQEGTVMLRAVDKIARESFTNVQGRKVVVLLSDGKDLGSAISRKDLLNQLEESDLLIYSIFYQTGKGFNKLVVEPDGTPKETKESKPKKVKKPKKRKGYSISIPVRGDVFTEEQIKLADRAATVEAVNSLQEMSDITAGRFYQSDTANLSAVFKRVAGELRQQYRLGFYAQEISDQSALQNIVVKVDRPETVVRARGKFRAKQL